MNAGLNLSFRFLWGCGCFVLYIHPSSHHHTITAHWHTRGKTSDTWFLAGLNPQLIETVKTKHWISASSIGLIKKLSHTVLFSFFGFIERPSKHDRQPSVSAAADLLGFFFSAIRGYIFTPNHCSRQLLQSIWQVNNTKLELVVLSGNYSSSWLVSVKLSDCTKCLNVFLLTDFCPRHPIITSRSVLLLQMSHGTLRSSAAGL